MADLATIMQMMMQPPRRMDDTLIDAPPDGDIRMDPDLYGMPRLPGPEDRSFRMPAPDPGDINKRPWLQPPGAQRTGFSPGVPPETDMMDPGLYGTPMAPMPPGGSRMPQLPGLQDPNDPRQQQAQNWMRGLFG